MFLNLLQHKHAGKLLEYWLVASTSWLAYVKAIVGSYEVGR